jgi:hypothetical protein
MDDASAGLLESAVYVRPWQQGIAILSLNLRRHNDDEKAAASFHNVETSLKA